MLQIKFNNNWYDFDFYGIKVFETSFTTNFIKQILSNLNEECKLIIDDRNIRWNNVIYINELTKPQNFLSLNKTNILYKKILEIIQDKSLINNNLINFICEQINKELEIEDLLLPQYDIAKIVSACFELNDSGYLKDEQLFNLLDKLVFNEKKLIIFDNLKTVTYKRCQKLLNSFNILIVTSDIREVLSSPKELEICCIIKNEIIHEIISVDKLLSYLEIKTSLPMNLQDLQNYLHKNNDQKSSLIDFYMKNF